MSLHKIRWRGRPEQELEVGDAELTDLTRYGVVLDTKATTDEGARRAAERQSAASTSNDENKEG